MREIRTYGFVRGALSDGRPFSIGAGWCQALSDCSVDSALMSLPGFSLLFGIGTGAFP
jgi:hypothetical protein